MSKTSKVDDETLEELIEKLAKESSFIVSSPETIRQLKTRGVKFTAPKPTTKESYLDGLFSNRREIANITIDDLPTPPQLAAPAVQSLYHEITECVLFGLYGAAITLSAILLEFALKYKIVSTKKGVMSLHYGTTLKRNLTLDGL